MQQLLSNPSRLAGHGDNEDQGQLVTICSFRLSIDMIQNMEMLLSKATHCQCQVYCQGAMVVAPLVLILYLILEGPVCKIKWHLAV